MQTKNINLYNKYRPKSFSEIIGQTVVKQLLLHTFQKERLLQSFMFYGAHGTGKTSLSRIFAKAWNCEKFKELGDVCNECKNCKLINENKTTDIYEVDSASHSGVEHVRELIQNSQYMPLDLNKKIYLMDECHNLSAAAWNALLKTIEEPYSDNVIFIFLTTNVKKIPETILSRCQKYNFSLLSNEELDQVIERVEKGEGRCFDSESRKLISFLSQGSARECITLIEQVFISTDQVNLTVADVEKTFSLANKEEQLGFIDLLINSGDVESRKKLVQIVDDLVTKNKHLLNYFSSLLGLIMDIYVYELTSDYSLLKTLNEEEVVRYVDKGVRYLEMCESLSESISKFIHAHSKSDWAKLTLFRLLPNPTTQPKVVVVAKEPEVVQEKKTEPIPEKTPDQIFISEELEAKLFYSMKRENWDRSRLKNNYEIYKQLKAKTDLNPELKKALFENEKNKDRQLVTTDRTVLLLFENSESSDRFNNLMSSKPELMKELNDLFISNYFWLASNVEQINFYKTTSQFLNFNSKESIENDEDKRIFNMLVDQLAS